jgi:spore maturation protein CgeB
MGVYVSGPEKCKAMLAAKIVLNQNHYAEIAGTNKRTFEVASIGAFQLTDTPALRDVFDPESEVAFFETQKQMLERIDEFLAQPERRLAMAARAQVRAHAEHTYEHRWVAHLEVLGQRPPAGFAVQPESLIVRAL